MSRDVENTVWKHARAKGSNLLVLLKLADSADDDGLNAWISARALSKAARLTDRAIRLVLHKLERDGEIVITVNDTGQTIEVRGRRFQPPWFIEVLCASQPDAYHAGERSGLRQTRLRMGRPPRGERVKSEKNSGFATAALDAKPENISGSAPVENSASVQAETGSRDHVNRNSGVTHIRKDPFSDPPSVIKAGSARQTPVENRGPETAGDNIGVITKIAHESIDLCGLNDLPEVVKARCASLHIPYDSGVVRKAIESAQWQRAHR